MGELSVDADGLRSSAMAGQAIGAALSAETASTGSISQPSQAGVLALDTAVNSVRARQANRVTGQAADLTAAATRYDDTDGSAAEDLSVTM